MNVTDYALTELALTLEEFEDLTWLEFYYKKLANETKLARQMEPTRILITTLINSFAGDGKKYTPQEIMQLVTDYNTFELTVEETDDEFFKRMATNNFYQSPTSKDKNNMDE